MRHLSIATSGQDIRAYLDGEEVTQPLAEHGSLAISILITDEDSNGVPGIAVNFSIVGVGANDMSGTFSIEAVEKGLDVRKRRWRWWGRS